MKAIQIHQFGDPSVLRLAEVPEPRAGAGQVVVNTKAIGVNPVDTYIRAGLYGDRSFPYTPGLDAAGIVDRVGSGVKSLKPGDRVFIYGSLSGTYAEKILCTEAQVHPLPERVSFAQGAALGVPYATAYFSLFNRAQAKPGETVLVHGASGGVGTAAVQIARAKGLTVVGTGGTPRGRELVLKEGAHHVLDHHAPDYLSQLMTLTQGRGVDIILEMLANVNLGKDLTVLAHHGRVVVIGSRGTVEINPRETMSRHADIRGMALLTVREAELAPVFAALSQELERGTLNPVIGKELPLAEAPQAHEAVMTSGAYGKIVLIPSI